MTWIIGRGGPFGYAVALSDIRITLSDGTELDCLQKIYNVGPHLALGFAGSVSIGLEVIRQLSEVLPRSEEDLAWIPQDVAQQLPKGTRELFHSFPKEEQKLGLHLILLATHPSENDGAAPWAKCYVYRFFSPDFAPLPALPLEIVSIGSGSQVEPYVEALQELENSFEPFKLQQHNQYGAAIGLMSSITSALSRHPVDGISPFLQICIVSRGKILIGDNCVFVNGESGEKLEMPKLATNFTELEKLLSQAKGSSLEKARC